MGKRKKIKAKTKVNVKARLNRHLRIVKETIGINKNEEKTLISTHHYGIVIFLVVLIMPIYPTLASMLYNTSTYDFYRGNIDESSIIESYFGGEDEVVSEFNNPIVESTDSFISVNTILDDERDLMGINEIVEYEVNPGESFYSISYKFGVSTNSIYWANDFTKNHTLQPGEVIKVPPVTGLIHQVKSGDTVGSIAKKYDIEEKEIKQQNAIKEGGKLIAGEVLVIPGAIRVIPKPVYKKPVIVSKPAYKNSGKSSSEYVPKTSRYKLVWRKPQHTFYWGNCTRYIAQYKNVNWGGNANRWIKNAKAKGHSTGADPSLGSIVQLTGRGYNPKYGHVAIVMDITPTHIIVSDMNYRRLNEVTYRKIPRNDRSIDGYIYVD